MAMANQPAIEAKLVLLGSQGVGKTSLVSRLMGAAPPENPLSTVGASFVTRRLIDVDSNTVVRLQIWDTAGQERFRSISRLYYRSANAALLCYDVTDEKSWHEMKGWLKEVREQAGEDIVLHVVGCKIDLIAEEPSHRAIPFEQTVSWLASEVAGVDLSPTPNNYSSPSSKRSSMLWHQEEGWDNCSEVTAKDGEGIEELLRVLARKLVEQRHKRDTRTRLQTPGIASESGGGEYFDGRHNAGSFRLGHNDRSKRQSWLGLPSAAIESVMTPRVPGMTTDPEEARRRGRCC